MQKLHNTNIETRVLHVRTTIAWQRSTLLSNTNTEHAKCSVSHMWMPTHDKDNPTEESPIDFSGHTYAPLNDSLMQWQANAGEKNKNVMEHRHEFPPHIAK